MNLYSYFRDMTDSRLSTALMVVSAAMILVGGFLAPPEGSALTLIISWAAVCLTLITIFLLLLYEMVRRSINRT